MATGVTLRPSKGSDPSDQDSEAAALMSRGPPRQMGLDPGVQKARLAVILQPR